MYIFISHSSADHNIAWEMCTYIENNGASCFIAPRDIHPGREYAEEIINGIERSDAMILIMSEKANHSPHVLREVERAVSRSIPILVYKLEDVVLSKSMEYFLMAHQWITGEKKKDYSEILNFIKEHEENAMSAETNKFFAPTDKTPTSKKVKKHKKFLCACVVIVILFIGIIGIFWFQRTNKNTPVYALGDTITFGSYNDEPIEWRILKISEENNHAVLVSSQILTMKAYDAAEGGTFNSNGTQDFWSQSTAADIDFSLQIQVRGNNDWSLSNIRTWLNSSEEVVIYSDQAPFSQSMSERTNGYQNEPGFLYGFSEEELSVIVKQEIKTPGNAFAPEDEILTEDYVFLLSKDELNWFKDAGISIYATPTAAALEQDDSNWYDIQLDAYNIHEYYWWLRDPVPTTTSQCYLVDNGYTQNECTVANVGTEGYGIRPAIVIDLDEL